MDAQSHKKLLAPPQQQLAASHNYTYIAIAVLRDVLLSKDFSLFLALLQVSMILFDLALSVSGVYDYREVSSFAISKLNS